MSTITCPRCGTENPANAMNCKQCRINLKFALENPGAIEHYKQREQPAPADPGRRFRLLAYVLTLLLFAGSVIILGGIVIWIANSLPWYVVDDFKEAFAGRPVSMSFVFFMLLLLLFAGC